MRGPEDTDSEGGETDAHVRRPLTDERLNEMRRESGLTFVTLREFRVIARAVELEHRIT